jgi:hypothetical protein
MSENSKSYLNIIQYGRRSTCQTSFNKAFFMKDDANDEVLNGTPKILIPFDGVVN